jgi:hypothetical protein
MAKPPSDRLQIAGRSVGKAGPSVPKPLQPDGGNLGSLACGPPCPAQGLPAQGMAILVEQETLEPRVVGLTQRRVPEQVLGEGLHHDLRQVDDVGGGHGLGSVLTPGARSATIKLVTR